MPYCRSCGKVFDGRGSQCPECREDDLIRDPSHRRILEDREQGDIAMYMRRRGFRTEE